MTTELALHVALGTELVARLRRWGEQRATLSSLEESGKFPHANDWEASDDDAAELVDVLNDLLTFEEEAWNSQHESTRDREARAVQADAVELRGNPYADEDDGEGDADVEGFNLDTGRWDVV